MGPWSGMQNWIRRYDREGRRVPFDSGDTIAVTQPSHGYKHAGFTVAPNGDIYVLDLAPGVKHRTKEEHNVLNIYGPDGRMKKAAAIPWLTSAAWGPRIDSLGFLYFTEAVAPLLYRPSDSRNADADALNRGSLVKFRPDDPRLVFGDEAGSDAPYVLRQYERAYPLARMIGGELLYYGTSPVPFGHCVCPAAQFDLDGFARAFVPDAQNYCVKVLDTAGNLLTALGGYGNRDSRGPESAVPVPDIPIRSPSAIAAGNNALYVFDGPNQRVVRVRLVYAASQSAPVRWP